MASREILVKRKETYENILADLYKAYGALASGGVQTYSLGSRSLTRIDITKLREEISYFEREIENLENMIKGKGRIGLFGSVPLDR